jgi:hypothetical protein
MTRSTGFAALAFALATPATAPALDLTPRDVHLRAGLHLNPDQFHVGVQASIGSLGRVGFRPSLDLGLGNGVRLLSLNGDVLYRFDRGSASGPSSAAGPRSA